MVRPYVDSCDPKQYGTVSLPFDHEQRLSTIDFLSDDPLSIIDSKDFRLSVTHSGSGYHKSFKILIIALRWTTTFLHLFRAAARIKRCLLNETDIL